MPASSQDLHVCTLCRHVYEPALGSPEDGIAPGTPWSAVPDDWCCPECGASKDDFEPLAA
ncbi:MAG: hypothetical protein RL456_2906 [Pseudomonadota bacterium]|jgi:rubredoxin